MAGGFKKRLAGGGIWGRRTGWQFPERNVGGGRKSSVRHGKRRPWRRRIVKKYGRRRQGLRRVLILALAAETGCLMSSGMKRMELRLIRQESQYRAEWISPWEAAAGGEETFPDRVYGIRLCPETMEIQFYSRRRSIRSY